MTWVLYLSRLSFMPNWLCSWVRWWSWWNIRIRGSQVLGHNFHIAITCSSLRPITEWDCLIGLNCTLFGYNPSWYWQRRGYGALNSVKQSRPHFLPLQIHSQMSNAVHRSKQWKSRRCFLTRVNEGMRSFISRKPTRRKELQIPKKPSLRIFAGAMYARRWEVWEERRDWGEFVHRNPVSPLNVHSLLSALKCTQKLFV